MEYFTEVNSFKEKLVFIHLTSHLFISHNAKCCSTFFRHCKVYFQIWLFKVVKTLSFWVKLLLVTGVFTNWVLTVIVHCGLQFSLRKSVIFTKMACLPWKMHNPCTLTTTKVWVYILTRFLSNVNHVFLGQR